MLECLLHRPLPHSLLLNVDSERFVNDTCTYSGGGINIITDMFHLENGSPYDTSLVSFFSLFCIRFNLRLTLIFENFCHFCIFQDGDSSITRKFVMDLTPEMHKS